MAERRPVRTRPRPRPARDDHEGLEYDEPEQDEGNEVEDEATDVEVDDVEVDDSRPPRRRRPADDSRRARPRGSARGEESARGKESISAAEAAKLGLRQIAELTGKPTEGVTWVDRSDDDGWTVGVEVVEDRRIPSAADILSIYEIEMDLGGELLSYRRVRRYSRGRGDEGDGGK